MPKLVTTLLRGQIALLRPLLNRMDLDKMRKLQDALGALGTSILPDDVRYEAQPFDDFEAAWALPLEADCRCAILYLHGGSYTAGSLSYCKGFGGILAENTRLATLCAAYRLAPEYPFPAALQDALAAYRLLLERYEAGHIALVGESAGGGLCFSLLVKLKQEGLPLPACTVAISPWTDLTLSLPSSREGAVNDPMLSREGLAYSAHMYGGEDLANPLISPLYADVTGLPPTLIMAGTDEILMDDSLQMAARLNRAGVECRLEVEEGLWHAYVLYPTPESKEAVRRLTEFIWEATGHVAQG